MRRSVFVSSLPVIALWACIGCDAGTSAGSAPRPVIVQGAMDVEIRKLAGSLAEATEEHVGGWTFWRGTLDGYPVVVSKTMKGMSNAAAATALGVERYHPIAIVNQGTAGGHQPDLHVYDIVLGVESVNLGSIKTPFRARGSGMNPSEWSPLDLLKSEGSAGLDPRALTMRRLRADDALLAAARRARNAYSKGHVADGVIGSADAWNSELDRIARFHDLFGTSVEDMETAAVAQIAQSFQVPFLGIRVLSNNVTNGEAYRPGVGDYCQDFVRQVLQTYNHDRAKP
jgi:adenosylhomocysteine nucleosidase